MRNDSAAAAFLAAFLMTAPLGAEEADPQLTDPIAKAPELVLGDLLPQALDEAVQNPFDKRPSYVTNAADGAFEATFEISSPAHPFVIWTLYVSESDFATSTVDQIFAWADGGTAQPSTQFERSFPDGFDCIADVASLLVSCRFGSAAVQFSAVSLTDDAGIGYDEVKDIFLTLPTDNYAIAFGRT